MSRRKKQQEPPAHTSQATALDPLGLHILDKFTSRDLDAWNAASKDIDQLQSVLYFAVRPMRIRKKDELIAALNKGQHKSFTFSGWHRIVDYKYSNAPLSVVGSIKSYGGRFNIGQDVDHVHPGNDEKSYMENFHSWDKSAIPAHRTQRCSVAF